MFSGACSFLNIQSTKFRGSKRMFPFCVHCQQAANAAVKSILLSGFSILPKPKLKHAFCPEKLTVKGFHSEKYLDHLY